MVAKLFTKPFGVAGDKTPIPNGTQVDGTVSYETGFGADYERQLGVDPAAKNIGRQTFNELMFDATTSLQEMQAGFGTSVYDLALAQALPGGGYPKGALIPRLAGDGFWLCTVAANASNPDTGGAGWVQVAMPQGSFYAIDTGVANAYSCVFSPALTTRSETQPLTVRIKFTNTGASTVNDGLGTVPLVGLAQAPLQGGEVAANGVALLQWVAAISSYVIVYATGGSLQVQAATKSQQAVNANQIQSQSVTAFTTTGTATAQVLTPIPAISGYVALQRFNVTFNVASGLNPTINVSGQGAKSLKQYDSAGNKVAAVFAANQNSDVVYDGTDCILLDTLPPSANAVVRGAAANLRASTTGLSAIAVITADEFCVKGVSGSTLLPAVNVTVNLANAGANGLDTGALAGSLFYYFYIIFNPTSGVVAGLASLNASVPALLPAGFTQYGRVGGNRTQAASPFNLLSWFLNGKTASYKVVAGSNVLSFPMATSGSATLATVPLGSFVPSTAIKVKIAVGITVQGYVGFAPNGAFSSNPGSAYLSLATPSGFPFVGGYNASGPVPTMTADVPLDNTFNILYASSGAQGIMQVLGWEEQ